MASEGGTITRRGGLRAAVRRARSRRGGATRGPRGEAVEAVLRAVAEQNTEFLRLWFTDVLGFMKSFAIPAEQLEVAFAEGVTFDGSAIEGFARRREEDLVARPDPFTFQVLPWQTQASVGTMFGDISSLDGAPFPGDPRAVLRRVVARAAAMGYTPFVGPELEFFLFGDESGTTLLDRGTYFDVTTLDVASDFRRRVIRYLERLGIPVEESHHEVASSQHEIDLRYADALTMADSIMAFRLTVREVARELGVHATFMPKPIQGQWGSGMHLHLALYEGARNAFADGDRPSGLADTGERFVAGLLTHARALTAVTNQWVNSYKRLVPGYEAPVHVCWGRHNRSALVRVPPLRPGRPESTRVELRSPDAACNPYLALAVVIAAGLDGIEAKMDLPPEAEDDSMTPAQRAADGIHPLPENLAEAVSEMEHSELLREVLGDFVLEWIVRNKRAEWAEYRAHVTPFEIERYLPLL